MYRAKSKDYGTNFINTLEDANKLVNDVKSSGFAMIVDMGTMILNQNTPESILPVLANTKHIHVSMPFLKPMNEEAKNYDAWLKELLAIIKFSSYNKYLSIEMANVDKNNIKSSLELLKKYTME